MQDQLGSVYGLVKPDGTVAGYSAYDPYGNLVFEEGTQPMMAYAGLYKHDASDLYLATYRAYDPATARWLNRDPIREAGGLNLYAYVGGNPINLVDFYGLWAFGDPLPQGVVDSVTGFGDGVSSILTLGLYSTADFREQFGIGLNAVDYCSSYYSGGQTFGYIWGAATMWSAGLNGGSQSVFWSGNSSKAVAQSYGKPLESTIIGKGLNYAASKNSSLVPYSLWKIASGTYALNAKGGVVKVGLAEGRIWSTIEKPILQIKKNPISYVSK